MASSCPMTCTGTSRERNRSGSASSRRGCSCTPSSMTSQFCQHSSTNVTELDLCSVFPLFGPMFDCDPDAGLCLPMTLSAATAPLWRTFYGNFQRRKKSHRVLMVRKPEDITGPETVVSCDRIFVSYPMSECSNICISVGSFLGEEQ